MNINDSTNPNLAIRASQNAQGVSKSSQQGSIKPVAPVVDQNNSNNTNQNVNKDQSRFEVNEQAIAFLDEQRALQSESSGSAIALSEQSSNNGYAQSGQSSNSAQYDQPSQQNISAVEAYQSVDNIAQRENIKQFFGVNLFA